MARPSALAVALALAAVPALALAGADFDQRKAEELRLRREHRKAIEGFYLQCLRTADSAKCLPEASKFGEKRLASLRRSGQNTPTFRNPY